MEFLHAAKAQRFPRLGKATDGQCRCAGTHCDDIIATAHSYSCKQRVVVYPDEERGSVKQHLAGAAAPSQGGAWEPDDGSPTACAHQRPSRPAQSLPRMLTLLDPLST